MCSARTPERAAAPWRRRCSATRGRCLHGLQPRGRGERAYPRRLLRACASKVLRDAGARGIETRLRAYRSALRDRSRCTKPRNSWHARACGVATHEECTHCRDALSRRACVAECKRSAKRARPRLCPMARANAPTYLPPSARAARVPSRHGLRNAYSTQPSAFCVSPSSAIGGSAAFSSRTKAKKGSVASARELGQ
jgi:hypothetical protein